MPLHPVHAAIARRALALPEAHGLVVAGGGAMLAHGLVDRPTEDLDLFTTRAGAVPGIAAALAAALEDDGWTVTTDPRQPATASFARLLVTDPTGADTTVDLAQDARMRDPVTLDVGPVLHPDELAADKTLALFGRGFARDLVDVDALTTRYTRQQLLDLAAEKDPGFQPSAFAAALRAAADRSDSAYTELGVDPVATAALRDRARRWADTLDAVSASAPEAAASLPQRLQPPTPTDQPAAAERDRGP